MDGNRGRIVFLCLCQVRFEQNVNINLVQSAFLFFVGHHKPERLGKTNFCLLFKICVLTEETSGFL